MKWLNLKIRRLVVLLVLISFTLLNMVFAEGSIESQYKSREFTTYKKALLELENSIATDRSATNLAYLSQIYSHFSYRDWHFGTKDKDYIEQAYKFGKEAVEKDPKSYLAYRALGTANLIVNNKNEALAALKTASELNANDAETWYLYACASNGSIVDENTEAGRLMKKALNLDPSFQWALEDMIMVHLSKGDTTSAKVILDQLTSAHGNSSSIKFFEGKVLLHSGKRTEARASFEEYIKANQGSDLANYLKLYLAK